MPKIILAIYLGMPNNDLHTATQTNRERRMEAKHTATPWTLIGKQGTAIWAGDEIVATVEGSRTNHATARATAEFIVLACNAHDDLVAALKEAVHVIERIKPPENGNGTIVRARDALIKAAAA
jgi:hypothetical protein